MPRTASKVPLGTDWRTHGRCSAYWMASPDRTPVLARTDTEKYMHTAGDSIGTTDIRNQGERLLLSYNVKAFPQRKSVTSRKWKGFKKLCKKRHQWVIEVGNGTFLDMRGVEGTGYEIDPVLMPAIFGTKLLVATRRETILSRSHCLTCPQCQQSAPNSVGERRRAQNYHVSVSHKFAGPSSEQEKQRRRKW